MINHQFEVSMGSFGDQLLKQGLISKDKLKKAKAEQRKSAKQQPKQKKSAKTQTATSVVETKTQNNSKQEAIKANLAKRAEEAQLKDLLQRHQIQINRSQAEEKYYFTLDNKVDFIYIDAVIKEKLTKKQVGITKFANQYYVLPANIQEKLQNIAPGQAFYLSQDSQSDQADGYEDYIVPDDLTW